MTENHQKPAVPALRLIRSLASEGDRIFTVDRARELSTSAGLSDGYLRQALHHLTKSGWVPEHQGVGPDRLESLVKAPIKGYRTLDPAGSQHCATA